MMTHSFLTADLAAQRTRTLRAEADAHRLARTAAGARTGTADEPAPRRRFRPWREPTARPA